GASSPAVPSGAAAQLSPARAGQPADDGTRARLLHRGGRGAHDDGLDVGGGSVAADEAPGELDGDPVGGEGYSLHEQSGSAARLVEESRLAAAEQDGLD